MGKLPVLSDIDLQRRLGALPGWSRKGNAITRTFSFRGFPDSVAFVQRTEGPAEEMNHHPDLDVRYNRVIVTLSTHDSGGVTENDVILAARLDAAAAGLPGARPPGA
ncbi:MAG: 4a-hydroxytetrahydrobiopterin dehydratase [Gemmatimonadales bacterium]|nr:4a-hydroxytetrahydrobiopterin dehydratase [Gemmatimonadota bacterium]MCL4212579.1 4a-hydroxytetrahydrobiopterin dehydratase [Gemmatimonadales bacterium]